MIMDRCVCFYEHEPPCPFCAEDNRDLHADLALCEAATVGPWIYRGWPGSVDVVTPSRRIITSVYGMDAHEANARGIFIAAARTGWPAAIKRALAAEAEVARLRRIIDEAVESSEWGVYEDALRSVVRILKGATE